MDSNEPTAWQDINPTTALARQAAPRSPSLAPATSEQFRNELTACLALVVPVGMTEEARREWLAVAWATVGHLPPDLLSIGCKAAREKCDHPSKVVPTILAETKEMLGWRRGSLRHEEPLRLERPDYVTPEQAAEILREFGINKSTRA